MAILLDLNYRNQQMLKYLSKKDSPSFTDAVSINHLFIFFMFLGISKSLLRMLTHMMLCENEVFIGSHRSSTEKAKEYSGNYNLDLFHCV